MKKVKRYELKITDKSGNSAIGWLAPLKFLAAEVALGFTMIKFPKFISAGEILINSLWVEGSSRLQKGGDLNTDACIRAATILRSMEAKRDGDIYSVDRMEPIKEGKDKGKLEPVTYKADLSGEFERDDLEAALGYTSPLEGNPMILTAGKTVVKGCWKGEIPFEKSEFAKDEELLIPLCLLAYERISMREGEIKKV